MTYREYTPVGPWRNEVVCAWTSVSSPPDGPPVAVAPDGCTDVLWSSTTGAVVVGPMTRPAVPSFAPGTEHAAIRLRPGRTERLLGVPASALTDLIVPLEDVLGATGAAIDRRLSAAKDVTARRAVLAELPGVLPAGDLDEVALAGLRWLVAAERGSGRRIDADRQITTAADRIGLSPRQFHRRVVAAVGYGPKRFQRVVRVQRVLRASPAYAGDLARLAADLGFADQAHLAHEVRALTGRRASEFVQRPTPDPVSGTYKRAGQGSGRLVPLP